jgi:AraC-like DNA-binding protein
MITMTTDDVAQRERAEYWADLVSRNVRPMRIEPSRQLPLSGKITARAVGDVMVAEVSGCGIHALHTATEVGRTRHHQYAACVSIEGEARIVIRGKQHILKRGDVFVTDSREEYRLDLERPWRHLVVSLPTHLVDERLARPEQLTSGVLREHPLVRLWASYLSNAFALSSAFSPAGDSLFARHCVELLAQAIDEQDCDRLTPSPAWRDAMYRDACRVIAFRFADPTLAPDHIAMELHISTRSLSRLFSAHNATVMRHVFDVRVRHAMKLLAAPEGHRSITAIAFACGFNDSSHFARAFAARVQETPSEWRRKHHQDS